MRSANPPPPSKVLMQSIQALTFNRGEMTTARRGEPIPQLQCSGKPCKRYQPESVACWNIGNDGAGGVQWKCEADLPSSLRLGKVEVSCEGWSRPGDRYVLQGSCGLDYGLVQVDAGLKGDDFFGSGRGWKNVDFPALLFYILFLVALTSILYSLARALFARFTRRTLPPARRFFPFLGWFGGGGPGGGGGGGPPPPPYSRHPKPADPGVRDAPGSSAAAGPAPAAAQTPGGLGFWAGLGIGGLGTYLTLRPRHRQTGAGAAEPLRPRGGFGETLFDQDLGRETRAWGGGGGEARRRSWEGGVAHGDRRGGGESSRMGEMRRATGFGGTNVR